MNESSIRVATDGSWFVIDGTRHDLSARKVLCRLLVTLSQARVRSPGMAQSQAVLISETWPGERILPRAAQARLYTAVATLRGFGLEAIERTPDGYLLAVDVVFEHSEAALVQSGERLPFERANLATIERYFEAFNARDWERYESAMLDDVQYRPTGARDHALDKAAMRQSNAVYLLAFADLRMTPLRHLVEGNAVATYYRLNSHFTGPLYLAPELPPIEPKGTYGELHAIEVFTLEHAQIVKMEDVWDTLTYFEQIGISLSIPKFSSPPTLAAVPAQPLIEAMRTPQEAGNVALSRHLLQLIDARKFDALPKLFAPSFRYTAPESAASGGSDAFITWQMRLATAFPDRRYEVRGVIAEKEAVAIQYFAAGVHYGPFAYGARVLAPTGRMAAVRGTLIVLIREGQVEEIIDLWDMGNMLGQLGL